MRANAHMSKAASGPEVESPMPRSARRPTKSPIVTIRLGERRRAAFGRSHPCVNVIESPSAKMEKPIA